MKGYLYKLTCLTNLYVGSGETNFSVVDNEVSKDPVTGLPMIHSSGVKGAFRQFFEDIGESADTIKRLFGSSVANSKQDQTSPGSLKFLDAYLYAQAVRASMGKKAYYLTISTAAQTNFAETAAVCGVEAAESETSRPPYKHTAADDTAVNVEEAVKDGISTAGDSFSAAMLGLEEYVVLPEDTFKNGIPLPVFARNQLDDHGISKQLWYEEVVPHKSVLFFAVLGLDGDVKAFDEKVNTQIVQFGGDASIGRGFCRVNRIGSQEG